jgi:PTS system nitrogen regulatory IIA component
MRLSELLSTQRVGILRAGRLESALPLPARTDMTKTSALALVAAMLASGTGLTPDLVERVLQEREKLQSTGIGDGVAIPHGALSEIEQQCAALLVVPGGMDFDAIDGCKVQLIFAVLGPKRATGEHLKTLARVSRLLRSREFRNQLIESGSPQQAYDLIAAEENGTR